MQALLAAIWAFAIAGLTRMELRTNAGTDFQARVMGDGQGSTGTAAYAPAAYIGLATSAAVTPDATHTTLPGEVVSGGLSRRLAVYQHTNGTNTYTLQFTFTSDASVTVYRIGVFNGSSTAVASANNTLVFHTSLNASATLVSGDQLQITETVTL